MPTKGLLLFDFDGVVVDSFDICFEITRLREPGITKERFLEVFEGNIHEALEKGVIRNNIDFPAHYAPLLKARSPVEAVPEALEALSKNFQMAIISANSEIIIRSFLTSHGLEHHFDLILGHETERRKTLLIAHALKKYSAPPETALMITDTLGDLKEAAQVDVRALAVLWGFHSRETLKRGEPHGFIESPRQIPQAVQACFPKA